ncbi:DUF445 domain-containing protein [Mumia sp. zg.B53]|uniref:DUF445 domain-containing protein n=1 Tax=Mumia sp. zg.B53 TaxID=2855449 RepID=UPI0027E3AC82|nr:DUF445 domain-containing protein [Mumia sp. zg.B53]
MSELSTVGFTVPSSLGGSDEVRRRGLRRMRTLATGLLVVAAVIYALTHGESGALGYVNAGAEAAMVGAIADWFAVTAIFKHPMGLPIPHTALIPRRKDALGESLQEFVSDNFLNEPVVRERVEAARISLRVGSWLADPVHARRIVDIGSRVLRDGLSRISDDDVAAIVREVIVPRLKAEQLSPAVGQALGEIVRDGAHHGLVDIAAEEMHRWLVDNQEAVESMVAERAPWWTPHWVDGRISTRMYREALSWVDDVRTDPDHSVRQSLDAFLVSLAGDLEQDPDTQARAEALKERILSQPQVVDVAVALWSGLRHALLDSLDESAGMLRTRMVALLCETGERVAAEPELQARLDRMMSDTAAFVVTNYGSEIATVISETVNRWDGKEASRKIELHVGRDLQFIRINGTVVGALAGVTIHAVSQLL